MYFIFHTVYSMYQTKYVLCFEEECWKYVSNHKTTARETVAPWCVTAKLVKGTSGERFLVTTTGVLLLYFMENQYFLLSYPHHTLPFCLHKK